MSETLDLAGAFRSAADAFMDLNRVLAIIFPPVAMPRRRHGRAMHRAIRRHRTGIMRRRLTHIERGR